MLLQLLQRDRDIGGASDKNSDNDRDLVDNDCNEDCDVLYTRY